MSIFGRIFKIGQAQAHAVVDQLEDPIKLTEQGIRDLKQDLQNAMQGLAEIKGVSIRLNKEAEDSKRQADEYERKAMLLLQRAQAGQIDPTEADRLASQALTQQQSVQERAQRLMRDAEQQQRMVNQLQDKVQQLKSTITTYENELITLRARAKTAASTKKINQHLAKVDSSSTIAMLERMKQKVEEDEALAQAYGEVGQVDTSLDSEINRALTSGQPSQVQDKLQELKNKLGTLPYGR